MHRYLVMVCAVMMLTVDAQAAGQRFGRRPLPFPPPSRSPIYLSGFGEPLSHLGGADLQNFSNGQLNFKEVETLSSGLGPLFNSRSCAGCHFQPAIGGGGLFIAEIRVRNNPVGGPVHIFAVDNLLRLGPQSQGGTPIFTDGDEAQPLGCQITAPGCVPSVCQQQEETNTTFSPGLPICDPTSASFAAGANCSAERLSTPLFGLGLVEAVSDQTLTQLAQSEPAAVQGTVKQVTELGQQRIARFGWKDDHATLRAFSADAYLNEVGITSPDAPQPLSNCALTKTDLGVTLQTADDPEDTTDPDGHADIDRFADFMRALSPPPRLPQNASAQSGAALFNQMGCNGCHTTSLTTASNPASFVPSTTGGVAITQRLNGILANQIFHPYSDFLLHDMGALGDGITSGTAGPTLMRTAPLWGIRARSKFLHDGRADDIPAAIRLHDGQGKSASTAFQALSPAQQQSVVDFLDTI